MAMLARYRNSWADLRVWDRLVGSNEVHLCVWIAPGESAPEGFTRAGDTLQCVANVKRDDPDLTVFRVLWRNRPIGVYRVELLPGRTPLVMAGMNMGDSVQTKSDVEAGWVVEDRCGLTASLALTDPDLSFVETKVRFAGE